MTVLTATSAADALTKLKAAAPGDEVILPSGKLDGFALKAILKADPGVTLRGAADGTSVLSWFAMNGCAGIALRDFGIAAATGAPGSYAVNIGSCDRYVLDNLTVTGNPNTATPGDNGQTAINLRNCTNGTVSNCEVSQVAFGIQHMTCTGLTITGNHVHHFRIDAIRGGGSSYVTVTKNRIHDAYPLAGDHSDAIQFWTSNTTTPTTDILVQGNDIRVGGGLPMQGILVGNEANIAYERLAVVDNIVAGSIWNAISVSQATDPLIEGNFVLGFTGVKDATGKTITPWIMIRESTSGRLLNNVAPKINPYLSSGYTDQGNVIIPLVEPGDFTRLNGWLATPEAEPPVVDPKDAAILELQRRLAAEEADDAGIEAARLAAVTEAETLKADLKAVRSVLAIVTADRDDDRAAMTIAAAALGPALASYPQ